MLARHLWHKSLTDGAIIRAVLRRSSTLDNPGFCLICGVEHSVEPDAQNLECEACGAEQVFGVEELLFEIAA